MVIQTIEIISYAILELAIQFVDFERYTHT